MALLVFSGCKESLLHGLDELRANRVLVALADAGIWADKRQSGAKWNVQVSRADTTQALKVLEAHRLLRRDLSRATAKNSSLIKTREERKIFLERQLAWGIERTLEAIPDVLEARVHLCMYVEHEMRIRDKPKPQSASVLIVHREGALIDVSHVKLIVAGAAGIDAASITVITSLRKSPKIDLSSLPKSNSSLFGLSQNLLLPNVQWLIGGVSMVILLLILRRAHSNRSANQSAARRLQSNSKDDSSLGQGAVAQHALVSQPSDCVNGTSQSVGIFEL